MRIGREPGDVTIVAVAVADQAALLGLIVKICDLGLPLISVQRIDREEGPP